MEHPYHKKLVSEISCLGTFKSCDAYWLTAEHYFKVFYNNVCIFPSKKNKSVMFDPKQIERHNLVTLSGAAYKEALISLQGSSIRFLLKEIKAKFKGGYLRYPRRVLLAS